MYVYINTCNIYIHTCMCAYIHILYSIKHLRKNTMICACVCVCIDTEGAKKHIHILRKENNCIKIVILNRYQ